MTSTSEIYLWKKLHQVNCHQSNHLLYTISELKKLTHLALWNEHFSHTRIPETESPCHAEWRFTERIPLQRAEGTAWEIHRVHHRHIIALRAGYVHHRLPAWREADDWCDERRITALVPPCKPTWAIKSAHTKMYPPKNPTGLNRTIWACWIFEESDISKHEIILLLRQSPLPGTRCKTALLPQFSRCSFDDVPDGSNWIIHVKWGF